MLRYAQRQHGQAHFGMGVGRGARLIACGNIGADLLPGDERALERLAGRVHLQHNASGAAGAAAGAARQARQRRHVRQHLNAGPEVLSVKQGKRRFPETAANLSLLCSITRAAHLFAEVMAGLSWRVP